MRIAGLTHAGRVRARNEDAMGWDEDARVAVVADGMGGHPCGDVAARLAVDTALEAARRESGPEGWLEAGADPGRLLRLLNAAVRSHTHDHPECAGMGTTVALLAAGTSRVAVAHAGDSRIYQLHEGRLKLLTRDHNLAREGVDQGWLTPGAAREAPERHQITRALGLDPDLEPEVSTVRRRRGDMFLLCSDGLSSEVPDREIEQLVTGAEPDLDPIARLLVRTAVQRGGRDNITVVMVRV